MFHPDNIDDAMLARLRELNEADERLILAFAKFELELAAESELEFMLEPEPALDLVEMMAFTPRPPKLAPLTW